MDPKTSDWRPGPTVCRCCLAEGCYKDISTEYFWMGKREVYSEMLSDNLNISIAYSQSGGPNSNSRLICEPCISRLRDASDFRRQVLECEKTFMQHLDPGSTSVQKELQLTLDDVKVERVKLEKKISDDEDFDDRVDFIVDDDDDDDLDDEPLMKLATKIPKKELDLLEILDSSQITVKRKATSKAKVPPAKKTKKREIVIKPSASKPSASATKTTEKKKKVISPNVIARKNATLLVQYTTAYPFKLPSDDVCCIVCCKEFHDPEDFRCHMMEEDHKSSQKIVRFLKRDVIKVDITDLGCRICSLSYNSIDDIAAHLSTVHCVSDLNLKYDLGVHSFKIYKDNYTCLQCPRKFVNLRALSRHIPSHYLNHTCETCGKSYGNKLALKLHCKLTHQSLKICRPCKKGFDSIEEKQKHLGESPRCWMHKCKVCGERFKTWTLKTKHTQTVHNTVNHYTCPECPEVFTDCIKRRRHFVATHTDKFKCTFCDKKFDAKSKLINHLLVHSSEKKFQCDVCLKKFSRKKSLKAHLVVHMEDKPYKCRTCNKQFNQRVSLKTHVSSYHPEKGTPKPNSKRVRVVVK